METQETGMEVKQLDVTLLPPALVKARALKCTKCGSNASPLFFGIQQISFEPPTVGAVAWCRGCVNLYEVANTQEHQVK